MSVDSKVSDVISSLREEERRLQGELDEAEKRVKELRAEVKKVQAGLGALASGGAKKRGRSRSRKEQVEAQPPACCDAPPNWS
jgi:chromosome segregation ATPase